MSDKSAPTARGRWPVLLGGLLLAMGLLVTAPVAQAACDDVTISSDDEMKLHDAIFDFNANCTKARP